MNLLERTNNRMKMSWLLAIALSFLVTASTIMETKAGEPSVYYIKSSKGNFLMAPRMTINSTEASHVLTKNVNNCTCKTACATAPSCKAWSVVKTDDGTTECRLASKGPLTVFPVNDSDATYFFREDSVAGKYSFHKEDNLLYVELTQQMHFDVGKKACRDIPGHRLMIIKTEVQYEYFQSLWETHITYRVAVDLMKKIMSNGSIEHVWGDGTLYSDTTLKQEYVVDTYGSIPSYDIYINVNHKFGDYIRNYPYTIICQANPIGVEW